MGKEPAVILALDVTDHGRAIEIAEAVRDEAAGIKVNWPIILSCGKGIIGELKERTSLPIIADLKLADIDNTLRLISQEVFSAGADFIIAHAFVGKQALTSLPPEKTILVVEMSHPGSEQFIQPLTEQFCALAKELSVHGVIAPATRPERIKQIRQWVGPNIKIYSPGVGAQGGKAKEAIEAGADFIIIGRSIYETENPLQAIKKLKSSS